MRRRTESSRRQQVRREDMVDGALSSTSSIADLVATRHDLPGRADHRREVRQRSATPSPCVIPDDKLAVSVELTDPERVAGFVNPGSEVAIFVSADPVHKRRRLGEDAAAYTRLLLAQGPVIGVGTTSVSRHDHHHDEGEQVVEEVPRTILTVAVNQKEAEKLIYAAPQRGRLLRPALRRTPRSRTSAGVTAADLMPELLPVAHRDRDPRARHRPARHPAGDAARVGGVRHDGGARAITCSTTRTSSPSSSARPSPSTTPPRSPSGRGSTDPTSVSSCCATTWTAHALSAGAAQRHARGRRAKDLAGITTAVQRARSVASEIGQTMRGEAQAAARATPPRSGARCGGRHAQPPKRPRARCSPSSRPRAVSARA